jgi:preprotein translocase subunit SecA
MFDFNKRKIKKIQKRVDEINKYYEEIQNWSEEELKNRINSIRTEFKETSSLTKKLENEAMALIKKATKIVTGLEAFDVQLIGALILLDGDIAEMKTGEGKTLVSIFPMAIRAYSGEKVHLVTANTYLAERDEKEIGEVLRYLGLTTSLNKADSSVEEKRKIYEADVIYGTASEFGFDYLRNNLTKYSDEKTQTELDYVLIDEADSILIDEARTPLVISGAKEEDLNVYNIAAKLVKNLVEKHINIDIETKNIWLSDEGIEFVQKQLKIDNLYAPENQMMNHKISNSLRAQFMMIKDIDYIVSSGKVEIIDSNTGRVMEGRRFSEGLHQSIEAKENLKVQNETSTMATVTIQNYFRMYESIAGMTGTAKTEEEELHKIYNLNVWVVPTNKEIKRVDKEDIIYLNKKSKWDAIANEIKERHSKGQPVLAGTASIEASEQLSNVLKKQKIKHELLNAKNHKKEAEIISNAGKKGAITIATNMAGRGTDIKIDEETRALGGLCVIGTEKHDSRRIDNQLKGRSGRQGDPGDSQFFISLEDELIVRFQGEKLKGLMEKMGMEEDTPLQVKMINKNILSSQKRMEGSNFDSRKNLIDFDSVLNEQMLNIYEERDNIMLKERNEEFIVRQIKEYIELMSFDIDLKENPEGLEQILGGLISFSNIEWETLSPAEIKKQLTEEIAKKYNEKRKNVEETFDQLEKYLFLEVLDTNWIAHVDALANLKEGIHLRSYAQNQPVQEYKKESFELYNIMIETITKEFIERLMRIQIK